MTTTPPLDIPVSMDYTGRDFYTIRAELIARIQDRLPNWTASDPADFGVALVEAFSYLGDLMSYYIDRAANESLISTAVQRSSVLAIAQNYGYVPAGYRQASTTLTFSNTSGSDITVPIGTVLEGSVVQGDVVSSVVFTTLSDVVVPAAVGLTPGSATVLATHGEVNTLVDPANSTSNGELIGSSTGDPNMTFALGNTPVVDGSVQIYVQDGAVFTKWTSVQHLMDYGSSDPVFSTSTDENDVVSITFGNGVSGSIPTLHSEIRAVYTVGGGSVGNVPIRTLTTISYVPGLSGPATTALQAVISVTNLSPAIGGSDPESTDQIRINVPLSLRASNRAVTLQDYASLALGVTGIGKANAAASVWTSVTLYIAPSRTAVDTDAAPGLDSLGNPTLEFSRNAADVQTALADKMLLGTTLTIQHPTYVDASVIIGYTKLPQYTTSEVELALRTMVLVNFGYNGMYFQDTIYPQTLASVLSQYPGVSNIVITDLYRTGGTVALTTLIGAPGEIFRFLETNVGIGPI